MDNDILNVKLKDLATDENLKKTYVILKKTSSPFTKDLTELPKIKKVLNYYLSQHPELGEYPVRILPHYPNAFFDFKKNHFTFAHISKRKTFEKRNY